MYSLFMAASCMSQNSEDVFKYEVAHLYSAYRGVYDGYSIPGLNSPDDVYLFMVLTGDGLDENFHIAVGDIPYGKRIGGNDIRFYQTANQSSFQGWGNIEYKNGGGKYLDVLGYIYIRRDYGNGIFYRYYIYEGSNNTESIPPLFTPVPE